MRCFLPVLLTVLCSLPLSFAHCQTGQQLQFRRAPRPTAQLGRGVNFGNMLEAPNEGEWGLFVEEIFFDKAVEAGFDHIRLPVSWTHHAAAQAPYTIDPEFFDRVEFVVDEALAHGLKVLLNDHHHDDLDANPAAETDRFLGIWQQIATRFQDRPDAMLYFEILNEPHGEFNNQPQLWNQLMVDALAVIRQSNPTRKVVVGPVFWNSVRGLETFVPPTDSNLIATVHNYEPFEFTHQGATWVDPVPPVGETWDGDRFGLSVPLQNWSWNTEIQETTQGLLITYTAGWAGFQVHNPNSFTGLQSVDFTISAGQQTNLIVAVVNLATGEQFEQTITAVAGMNSYSVDVSSFGGPNAVTNIFLQSQVPNPAPPYLLMEFNARSNDGVEKLIGSEFDNVAAAMKTVAAWGRSNKMPLYLGEFGAYEPADMESRVRWTTAVRQLADSYSIDWAYWELGAGFGIYDPGGDAWRLELLQALIPEFE